MEEGKAGKECKNSKFRTILNQVVKRGNNEEKMEMDGVENKCVAEKGRKP